MAEIKIKKNIKLQSGMTYIEIIVVLAIFAVLSTVVMFNYGAFQAKIDTKNLASDIALKIVEAQKSASSGKQPLNFVTPANWKPAYGVYFKVTPGNDTDGIAFNKKFIYFTDYNPVDISYSGLPSCSGECLEKIILGKGNTISQITRCIGVTCTPNSPNGDPINSDLSISFSRVNSAPSFYSSAWLTGFDYIRITVTSPKGVNAYIKIYNSGRIQVN